MTDGISIDNYNITLMLTTSEVIKAIIAEDLIPLKMSENSITVAYYFAEQLHHLPILEFQHGVVIHPLLIRQKNAERIWHSHQLNLRLQQAMHGNQTNQSTDVIIDFVDELISEALQLKASDIHLEPYATHARIRLRHDGFLYEHCLLTIPIYERILSRCKILANLDISEKRKPQDGHLTFVQHKLDIRLNTCPTIYGEKLVLRILDIDYLYLDISCLGMLKQQETIFYQLLNQPHGLILITGPTGSGKTMTLYAGLNYLNKTAVNVSSVEDPVEIELHGINQININLKIGNDFPTILKALLRQDPDVLMVGEIRDSESAKIAVQAAQTGHLVLSTLHTNNALETITRLKMMGVPFYNLLHVMKYVIAERLVRKLCDVCKMPDEDAHVMFGFRIYKAIGCKECHEGYRGRVGIFEFIALSDAMKQAIQSGISSHGLIEMAVKEGNQFLYDSGVLKMKSGVTSFAEISRVLGEQF